jgi:dolichol-phosphate mannosyltransferase
MFIFCLIPAYNEKGNLEVLTEKLIKQFRKEKIPFILFFVLQGEDGSLSVIKKLKTKHKQIDYVHYPKPLGIGRAYRVGFDHVPNKVTHIFTLDADLNHHPHYLPEFITCMRKNKADIVIGSRFIYGGKSLDKRIWKRVLSFGMNYFLTSLVGIPVHDISSGFRLMKKEVADKIKSSLREHNYPSYMEFIILSYKSHFRISEISITYTPRIWGVSKMNSWKTLRDYLIFLPRVIALTF